VTRWLPFPLVSLGLLVLWLLLNESVAAGHVLLGIVLGVAGGWGLARLEPPAIRLRRPAAIVELFCVVIADIVRSNIAVARIILGPRSQEETAGFMTIPLEMRSPWGLAALAVIITSTPGTLWVNFDTAKGLLTIHVLDLIDENAWIATIKGRYERRLMEIFE
jgi:multicomponent K+:H+ antiporter subunit E